MPHDLRAPRAGVRIFQGDRLLAEKGRPQASHAAPLTGQPGWSPDQSAVC